MTSARSMLGCVSESGAYAEPERWGADPRLEALLGAQGAAGFRALLEGFPDAIGIVWPLRDASGEVVDFALGYGNPKMLRSFRLPAATRDRYTLLEALPRMRGSRAFTEWVAVCETGRSWVREIVYDTPFGDGYMLGTYMQRVARLGGGLLIVLTDITEQRRNEAELRNFADLVAHDLREPVTGIAHLVTLLERRADAPPDPALLDLLRASTERARELIDGVLAYARAGEMQAEPVALARLMDEVGEDLRMRLEEAGATVEVGPLPEVRGDARQLRRLLQNLVANAVKFRGDEPPRVSVSAREGAEHWVVTVADNGTGVAAADQGRIFGMFARAHRDHDGTGIGLAVCRRVVEAHGGRIWVDSPGNGGSGSAFSFTLPR
jgi:signal transduction histidine kinase